MTKFFVTLFRPAKDHRLDVDGEDDQESYFKARKDLPLLAYPDEEEEMEYDDDGNPIPPERSKVSLCCALQALH